MRKLESKADISGALWEVSAALVELRDALVELSLSLKDWQFENNLAERRNTEDAVHKLMEQIMSVRNPSS